VYGGYGHSPGGKSPVSYWRLSFNSRTVHVGFAVDIVVEEQDFLQVLRFFSVSIIPTMPHMHISFIYHWHYIVLATNDVGK